MGEYVDRSYPAIGETLQYQRSDGATVQVSILPGAEPLPPAAPPQLIYQRGLAALSTGDPPRLLIPALLPTTPALSDVVPEPEPIPDNRYTIFVLLYGPNTFHDMHRRCIEGIIATVPRARLDLRIGSNQLCQDSVNFVESLVAAGWVTKHYRHLGNDRKYPVMREMFWDPSCPIQTKWLFWFDDDSEVKDSNWLVELDRAIAAAENARPREHMLGGKFSIPINHEQAMHIKSRPWYKGKPFRVHGEHPAANGNKVFFITGGCWALSVEAVRACNIPDETLLHNGGDWTIGEQLYQNGFALRSWNSQKQFIQTSGAPRRGLDEPHFGTAAWHALRQQATK